MFLAPLFTALGIPAGFATWLAGGSILATLFKSGLAIAATYLLGSLTPKPQAQASQLDVGYGDTGPRKVIFGKVGTAGDLLYRNAYGNGNRKIQDLYRLSDFRITEIPRVKFKNAWCEFSDTFDDHGYEIDTEEGDGDDVSIQYKTGLPSQTTFSVLTEHANPEERWSANHRGDGIALAYVRTVMRAGDFTSPWPPMFEVKGAPLYDWRKDDTVGGDGDHRWDDQGTWEYSENPVLMMYALSRGIYTFGRLLCGKGVPASRLPLARWTLAANICDEEVEAAPRYRASLIAYSGGGITHESNMKPLRESCAASWVEDAEGEYPIVGAVQAAVATITDDDIYWHEPFRFSLKRPREELVNTVSGSYTSPDKFYETADFAIQVDEDALAEDGETLAVSIPLSAVIYPECADRLASIAIRSSRYQANGELAVHPKFLQVKPGDWVEWVSTRYGQTFTFQVLNKRLGALGTSKARIVYLAVQQTDEGVFDPSEYTTVPPTVVIPGDPLYQNAPTGFAFVAIGVTSGVGQVAPGFRGSWDAYEDTTVIGTETQWRIRPDDDDDPDNDWIYKFTPVPDQVFITTDGVLSDRTYEYRYRIVTSPPRVTSWSSIFEVDSIEEVLADQSVGLGQLNQSVLGFLQSATSQFDELRAMLEQLGQAGADTAGAAAQLQQISQRFENATAVVLTQMRTSITGTGEDLTALAESLVGVFASVGDESATGLWRIRATAGAGDVEAQIVLEVRADVGDDYVTASTLWQAGYTGGNPAFPFSRFVVKASDFIVTDGSAENFPMVYSGGVLQLAIAHIGEVTAGVLRSVDNKFRIDLDDGSIEWAE